MELVPKEIIVKRIEGKTKNENYYLPGPLYPYDMAHLKKNPN